MHLELDDKVALISGSSKGLGLASARSLAADGCRVVLCARGKDALEAAAADLASIAGADHVHAVATDVTTADGAERVVRAAIDRFGRLDILVNNVGKATGNDI